MKNSKLITLLFFLVILTGCASKASFVYNANSKQVNDPKRTDLNVAVLPFDDLRENKNLNYGLLYLLPGMPFGFVNYDRLDSANGFLTHSSYHFEPSEDFPKALIKELELNEIFNEVFFTFRKNEPDVDLYIKGEIHNTKYKAKVFTYGLSVYGSVLWLIGLPAGQAKNNLSLKIKLIQADTQKELWSHEVKGEWKKTIGYYYNWGDEFDGYPLILNDGYRKLITKLNKAINEGLLE